MQPAQGRLDPSGTSELELAIEGIYLKVEFFWSSPRLRSRNLEKEEGVAMLLLEERFFLGAECPRSSGRLYLELCGVSRSWDGTEGGFLSSRSPSDPSTAQSKATEKAIPAKFHTVLRWWDAFLKALQISGKPVRSGPSDTRKNTPKVKSDHLTIHQPSQHIYIPAKHNSVHHEPCGSTQQLRP
jgi:hypothetical protein